MATLNSLFDEFLTNIEPDEKTTADAIKEHEEVRKWLAGHTDFKKIHVETFLAGSYRRNTSVTPIKDVDVVVICSMDSYGPNPRPLLDRLHRALADNKRYKPKATPRRRSIQIELARVDLDVVPTVAPKGVDAPLLIPDRDVKEWFSTNPKGHIEWTQKLNAATKQSEADRGRFVPLVKMARWWRQEQLKGKRHPKGHMIELSAGFFHDPKARDWADVFIAWLERAVGGLASARQSGTVPQFPDPGLPGEFIKTGMELKDFQLFYDRLSTSLPVARRARELAKSDLAASAKLWQSLFGSAFPNSDDDKGRGSAGGLGGPPLVTQRPDIRQAPTFG
jgi:hypothetical protein